MFPALRKFSVFAIIIKSIVRVLIPALQLTMLYSSACSAPWPVL